MLYMLHNTIQHKPSRYLTNMCNILYTRMLSKMYHTTKDFTIRDYQSK